MFSNLISDGKCDLDFLFRKKKLPLSLRIISEVKIHFWRIISASFIHFYFHSIFPMIMKIKNSSFCTNVFLPEHQWWKNRTQYNEMLSLLNCSYHWRQFFISPELAPSGWIPSNLIYTKLWRSNTYNRKTENHPMAPTRTGKLFLLV